MFTGCSGINRLFVCFLLSGTLTVCTHHSWNSFSVECEARTHDTFTDCINAILGIVSKINYAVKECDMREHGAGDVV